MGKSLRQQRAGKGSLTFKNPDHIHPGPARYPQLSDKTLEGVVKELVHDPGRYVPLARVVLTNGEEFLMPAAEGMFVGQKIKIGPDAEPTFGNVLPLSKIPEGTLVYNLELRPGDGGKLARQAGSYAIVLSKSGDTVKVLLPSKREKEISGNCRATIGVPAGAGRIEKPLLKAGNSYYKYRVKGTKWPTVRGVAMNAANHPFGGGFHQHEGRPTTTSRNAPPGRKVGHIAARRTGRRR
ncbi:50S ribosomal protein L2P [Acidilobus saccharovorans 345-15]|uniref:Large ribosomal subunit protein uL2 n=1 Tax=Acidilobus saccharovorans (strain DSM 16705 / JCM 18335 / VKM B-2471 / 345-15) TaxID=666510 RepID=D9Q2Z0_ACIS3|nr:50S ribosomal protein L2 [Acidilobus saccharovorans]ADL19678.1 50S ribosomal protein L2P [Acidilobus saccharovorans 345-15]